MNDIPSKIDKYEIIEEIGRGGMAIVYKGLHPFLDKYIAVKVLPEYFVQDKEFVERFTREAKVMFNLKHPNIVRIYDAGIYQGKYFIVMQYIEGKTLKALIREKGSIPIEQSVEIVMQVAEALSYAHKKGVIHRDIKPSNILIEKDTNKAYVTDFGIAKAVSNTKLTQTGVSLGTPEYMSPEQFLKSNEVDQRTDIYSLGIVFYEMLTGDIPFKGETPVGIAFKHVNVPPTKPRIKNPKISPYLEKIILKMLSKNLDERYKTMDALFKDLQYFKDKKYDKISALSYTEKRKCKLAVTSIPPDAKVYIDGNYIGKTPLTDVEVDYGKHKLLLVKSGYDDYNDDVFLNKIKSSVRLNITLIRENNEATAEETKTVFPMPSGQETQGIGKSNKETVSSSEGETIVSKPEERIIEKTQKVSSNTTRGNTGEAGRKTVMANKEQKPRRLFLKPSLLIPLIVLIIAIPIAAFLISRGRNTVNGNANNNSAVVYQGLGYISVTSSPANADVYINGDKIGTTPISRYKLKSGEYNITIKKEGYKDYTGNIDIEGNKTDDVSVALLPLVSTETSLSVNSSPQGAEVYIDNKDTGKETPALINDIAIGKHILTLKKEGYKTFSGPITIQKGEEKVVNANLVAVSENNNKNAGNNNNSGGNNNNESKPTSPVHASLSVTSDPTGAKVYVDGDYKGTTPLTISLSKGSYSIKIIKDGYKAYTKSIDAESGGTVNVSAVLTALKGTLSVTSTPSGAKVYIDKKYKGITPLNISLAPGSYAVKITKSNYKDYTKTITITDNKATNLSVNLSALMITCYWKEMNNGLYGGMVNSLAIDPKNTNIVYAGTVGGVFKSTNGGESWSKVNSGLTNTHVWSLAIGPKNTSTIYAGTDGGIFKSTNGGASWSKVSNGLTADPVKSIVIDPNNTNIVYAGMWNSGIFKSTNGGASWSKVSNGLTADLINFIAIDPKNTNIVYAGTWSGVFKSTDSGASWKKMNNGLPDSGIWSLAIGPKNTSTIYAGTDGGIFKSTNGGASWSKVSNGLTVDLINFIAIDPKNTNIVYAGTFKNGVFKSTNSGASWSRINNGLTNKGVDSLAIDPKNTNIIYAGTWGSVFKSTNSGESWSKVSNGLTAALVYSLAIDPNNTNIIYAGTRSSGVFKSTDSGASWSKVSNGLPNTLVTSLAIDPKNTNIIYAGTDEGIFKSTNGGTSWSKVSNGLTADPVKSIVIDPNNTNIVYAGMWNIGIFKSTNGGTSWSKVSNGLSNALVTSLAIDPQNTNIIYAGTSAGKVNGVFKSTNGGANWSRINNGLTNKGVDSLAIDPKNTNIIYAGTDEGIFKSTNGGTSWSKVSNGLPNTLVTSLAIDPQNTNIIYAGTWGSGVFKYTCTSP